MTFYAPSSPVELENAFEVLLMDDDDDETSHSPQENDEEDEDDVPPPVNHEGAPPPQVQCGVMGSLEPPCNAVGLIDRYFLGEHHLYQHPVYRRTKECSVNSPDYGPLLPTSPQWCLAPFDPEGILSSLMAAITCFVGLQCGHIALHFKGNMQRVFLWSLSSFPLLILGYVLDVLGVPFSKPLYTLSYMCITAGTSGFLLTIIFYIVSLFFYTLVFFVIIRLLHRGERKENILRLLSNQLFLLYGLTTGAIAARQLSGHFWSNSKLGCKSVGSGIRITLVDNTESVLQFMLHSKKWGTLAFVLLEILFRGLVAGVLDMKRVYYRL
ncbi:uncharacterized protein LOC132309142 [Cornus florida]|uniref:uncharacterized protein LOC132309142 n=1 Tax=Cornus florida TaxID=4283 RepID=UPI0028A0DC83|nr:uncharacterized protein LOC132309142 [Cornus florida]